MIPCLDLVVIGCVLAIGRTGSGVVGGMGLDNGEQGLVDIGAG